MFPMSGLQNKPRKQTKETAKVDEQQSKNVLDDLYKDLDENNAEELEEANKVMTSVNVVTNNQGQVAFSKQEEMHF